ncbi:glycoside hydrolase family 2 TIM barrel-domain containing protein [Psychroserpens algicola]|uniref:Glycoside hydrolase family 5 protein n=1 Tax=Psychroserpens algicola TaxID=1719034 RepID=A0ABT0H4L7_9FLAO|nr:glycoside hydrolase family 2 TIM barrel-domain containing protein [Psychroserpens algicola]MCK8479339.1 glycoside hydrolase family 5 protein [Psychroserpens algicola]
MVNLNRTIIRTVLIVSYILIISLVVYAISALFGYLNTGADRSTILHTELKKIEQYKPKVIWMPLTNEGRPIDNESLKAIETDYLDAWYVKQVAYKTNTTAGINDYYTDNARKNIFDFITLNSNENISIESTTLEHHPKLEFFSEDGQLAVITDNDVIEYKRVYKDNKLVIETNEISTYKVVLLLEDGFWRIRHLIKESTEDYIVELHQIATNHLNIKGINYYPQATPWDMFGDSFSKDTITKDFKIIKEAGLNSIRLFVQYDDFGKANVNKEKLDKLKLTLDAAETINLGVVITLFDFYGNYDVLDWTLNMRHAETIVSELKNHKAIIAWDIKNEPNLDFETRGKVKVIAWLEHMIAHVKSIDKVHPITIGWSNTQSASLLNEQVDFISFHYYEDLDKLGTSLEALKNEIPNKTLLMGEFGLSSYDGIWKPFGDSEKDQANYHKKAQDIIAQHNLQYLSWTLYDFTEIPKEVVGGLPWRKNAQKHFGFIDKNGAKKPAFTYISKPQ